MGLVRRFSTLGAVRDHRRFETFYLIEGGVDAAFSAEVFT